MQRSPEIEAEGGSESRNPSKCLFQSPGTAKRLSKDRDVTDEILLKTEFEEDLHRKAEFQKKELHEKRLENLSKELEYLKRTDWMYPDPHHLIEFDGLVKEVCSDVVVNLLHSLGYTHLLIQFGRGAFEPTVSPDSKVRVDYYRYKDTLKEDLQSADLVISHAGAGSCLEALGLKKKLVVVINETLHDNHQFELATALAEEGHLLYCIPAKLAETLKFANFEDLKEYKLGDPKRFADWLDNYLGVLSN